MGTRRRRALAGEWKIFTKGTSNYGKQAKTTGNRITIDLDGNIINN